ncbi:Fic/DOC family protein, partial [Campylobacter fetus]|uniref:Fic/DOC family protein n=1 Tax=Campylobacter fetus TaxID=196 RepID=UPI001F1BAD9C
MPFNELNEFDQMLLASNLIGAKNLKELNERERAITIKQEKILAINPIKGNFDYQHLKDIHKKLFEDVYVFAGFDRADIGLQGTFLKGNQHFVPGNEIKKYSQIIFKELQEKNLLKDCKDINSFSKGAANFMMELNALHPFREGNGRTQRIFINELAKNAGYKLDL